MLATFGMLYSLSFSHEIQKKLVVASNNLCCGMLGSQHPLVDGQSALVQGCCLLIVALSPVENGEVVQAASRVGMLGSQHPLVNGQSALVQGCCLLIVALSPVENGQVVQALGRVGMLRSQHPLSDGQ